MNVPSATEVLGAISRRRFREARLAVESLMQEMTYAQEAVAKEHVRNA